MIEKFDPLKGEMLQILSPEGRLTDESLKPDLSDETVLELYKHMVIIRIADQRALTLQRQGRFGTYAPVIGQEAAQVGSGYALGKDDWVFPSFRETRSTPWGRAGRPGSGGKKSAPSLISATGGPQRVIFTKP
jgi:pyruvate dehydrogenase E1 component alpha subunit